MNEAADGAAPSDVRPRPERLRVARLRPPWPYLLVGLGLLCAGFGAWRPLPAGVWHDDGVYMLVGKAIADGEGLRYAGVVGAPPAVKFPPLYPAVLAVLWSLLGSIGAVTLAATILNLVLLAAAGALFAYVLHRATDLPLCLAVAVAAVGFASADVVRTGLVTLSEPLFLFLTMVALALWPSVASTAGEGWGREGPRGEGPRTEEARLNAASNRSAAVLAVLLAAVVMTRTAGVAFVLAWLVPLALRGRVRFAAGLVAPAVTAGAVWGLWSGARLEQIPAGMRDILGGYGGWLASQMLTAPGTYLARLPDHATGVLEGVASLLLPGLGGGPRAWAAVPLAVLAALGLARLFRALPPAAWWTVGYLAVLLLWPYQDRRLLVPLHPFLVAAVAVGALDAHRRLGARPLRWLAPGVAVLWAGTFSAVTAERFVSGWPGAPYRIRAEQLATAVEALDRTAPPGAVVGAAEFWPALHLHGGWTVAPSARFNPRAADPETPLWGTPEEQLALWEDAGIDHLLLEQVVVHRAALDLQERRCPGSVRVLAVMSPQMVVRLDRPEACAAGTPDG